MPTGNSVQLGTRSDCKGKVEDSGASPESRAELSPQEGGSLHTHAQFRVPQSQSNLKSIPPPAPPEAPSAPQASPVRPIASPIPPWERRSPRRGAQQHPRKHLRYRGDYSPVVPQLRYGGFRSSSG